VNGALLGLLAVAGSLLVVGGSAPPARPLAPPRLAEPRAPGSRRWLLVGITVALAAVAAPLALVPPAVALARPRLARRRAQRTHARRVRAALPEAVDLLLLATGAGLSLPVAHPLVADQCAAPLGEALADAARLADRGTARADALVATLRPLGDRALALAHVLVDHLRYGVPLTPALERLRLELRLDRRRHAEQEARRVPVRLLGPLVACVLPAFALLTVIPLLAASLQSLPT
jgi:Flp pilus assembly protein TadB